ncbi:GNAT family N-acetyltransferase [Colwellia psychrerythraea]|uniref:Acetyltransferase, GNAT family n=1 Tax=Colwellia psychrerythraea (strain 34H / ATCC BAA-681) TaxID=167879 RepID=Q489F8_COLP3|nr:GNAT family N-acetyltransferase [Colwellia psychrerythraea]AAZ24172.1 acetyltransferase, GNAT family [Colwellia psychrerythraea 34H]
MYSFTTERLMIRPLRAEDEVFYCQLYADSKVMENIGKTITKKQARQWFKRALKALSSPKKSVVTLAIVKKSTNNIIGIQALSWQNTTQILKPCSQKLVQAEIGIMLTTKAQGQGFGKEAIKALMAYGFVYHSLDRINAFYAKKNLASERLFNSLHFIYDLSAQNCNSQNSYQYFNSPQLRKNIISK